jgi:type IV pilus assembly protein PilM
VPSLRALPSLPALPRGAPAVGLDVDRGALKAVQLSGGPGRYMLGHVGYRRLPPGAIADGEVADEALLASELKEFWSTHSFKGRNVYLGVANARVVVRLLDFPRMGEEDLRGAINFEAQEHIPMPLEEAVTDFVVLGPSEEGSDLDRILLVAAARDMISRYSSAVRAAGLRPAGVDVKALSLVRSTLPRALAEGGAPGAVVLMDVGADATSLCIAQGGSPTLTRSFPGGSDRLVESIADAADLGAEEAERQLLNPRVRIGPGAQAEEAQSPAAGEPEEDFDPALLYDVRRGLEDAVGLLAEDVGRSVEYHDAQPGARPVERILVTGEGALVRGMDAYLAELLGIEAHRGTPLRKLSGNKSNVSDDQLRLMEPVLAVALGLALEEG